MGSWTPLSTVFPTLVCICGIILSLISVSLKPEKELDIHWKNTNFFGWLLGYLILSYVIGMLPSIIIFVAAYTRSWKITLIFGMFCYIVFHLILNINWPEPATNLFHNFL